MKTIPDSVYARAGAMIDHRDFKQGDGIEAVYIAVREWLQTQTAEENDTIEEEKGGDN